MSIEDTRIAPTTCPECGVTLNGAARPNSGDTTRPQPGDFSVCSECQLPSRFDQSMQLVALTETDIAVAPLLDFQIMARMVKELGKGGIMQGIADNYDDV